jgi:ribonuclease E
MGGERPPETAEDEVAAPNLEEIPDEVIRLQDTVELPAWVPRAGPSTPPGPKKRTLPIAQPGIVERPASASASPPDEPEAEDGNDEREADTAAAAGTESPARRRRRRGRRGGRRNREARNQKEGEGEGEGEQRSDEGGAGEPGPDSD